MSVTKSFGTFSVIKGYEKSLDIMVFIQFFTERDCLNGSVIFDMCNVFLVLKTCS